MDLRSETGSELDLVALGECMVRLSPPGHERLEFARTLEVHVGGGEYNVAYAIARLGLRAGWVGGLVDNPLGAIVRNHARGAGVDLSAAVTVPYDGVGRAARMGLNFTEVGIGPRASVTMYDRGSSATSQLRPGDVDWDDLFGRRGVRWFHTGGIFTCLSASTRDVALEAVEAAHRHGTVVSYDLNFRSKLWDSETAIAATRPLLPFIDCLIGNEEDFQQSLGYAVEGVDAGLGELPVDAYMAMVRRVAADHPGLSLVGTTLREVISATRNGWSAILYDAASDSFVRGPAMELEVEDRVGGGDGFASGLIWTYLTGGTDAQVAVNVGTAHGALLQTTRGDTSQVSAVELRRVASGAGARIVR
jgi:2-dehydro-3-deoxygluconokinase